MRRAHLSLAILGVLAGAIAIPSPAHAVSGYYTADCAGCHGSTSTCNGCHRHGAGNVSGQLGKTSFTPGEPMAITVTAGTRTGWWRAAVVDQSGAVVQTASVASGTTATISVPAPDAAGTYAWRVAWYGNERGGTGGATWAPDPNNPNHGYRLASLPAFTVEAPQAPAPSATLTASSVDFGNVTVGQLETRTVAVGNAGNADLAVTGVTTCANTSPPFALGPSAAFSVTPGGTQVLTLTFAPTSTGAATGCFRLATNDAAQPTLTVSVAGAGTAVPAPSATLTPASLAFGSVTVGQSSTLTAVVGNTGSATLSVSGVTPCDGSNSAAFTVTPTAAFNVVAGVTQTLTVRFAPTAEGAASACWNLATNDPARPTLRLTAAGTGAAVAPPPPPPPPPPTDTCGSCHAIPPATGRHALHRSEGYGCSRCHGTGYSDTTVNAATHADGTKNVVTTIGWNATSRSCSNSCHGSESWGGTGTTPPPPTASCGSCHPIPPASGEHAEHREESISCARCHGTGYSNTTVNAATHDDGTTNVASGAGWRAETRSCSNSCHGSESWGSGGDDGDDGDDDDGDGDRDDGDDDERGDDLAVTAGSGAAGGCSSAGGSFTFLAFAGIAALAARRRRTNPRA